MDIQTSFASQLYDSARRLTATATEGADGAAQARGESFAEALQQATEAFGRTLAAGEVASARGITGQGDVQSVVEALSATELALQTATTIRDRVVEAYQDVLRMPV